MLLPERPHPAFDKSPRRVYNDALEEYATQGEKER